MAVMQGTQLFTLSCKICSLLESLLSLSDPIPYDSRCEVVQTVGSLGNMRYENLQVFQDSPEIL